MNDATLKAMATTILRAGLRATDPPLIAPDDEIGTAAELVRAFSKRVSGPRGFKALVVFTDARHLWSARLLKPGFRHCFVVVDKGSCWLLQDPLAHYTDISVLAAAPGHEIAEFYLGLGYRVAPTFVRNAVRRPLPPALFTCVEAVKRILGLRAWWIVTPFQLFKHLTKDQRGVLIPWP